MNLESLLPCSQQPAMRPYSDPDESHPDTVFNSAISRYIFTYLYYLSTFFILKNEEPYQITLLCVGVSHIIARQRTGKHVPTAMNICKNIEELFEAVIST